MSDDAISRILRKDPRYAPAAFEFVQEALRLAHLRAGHERHVRGPQLLEAFRVLARDQFGPLARSVLAEWGVHTTEDVGNIVFLCVQEGEMGQTDEDSIEDFRGVYDFAEAFPSSLGEVRVARTDSDDEDDDAED